MRATRTKKAFTMVEMLVATSIFAMIFGLCAMLYVQSCWRTANALELNNLEGQVRDLDRFLETTIENSTSDIAVVRTGACLECIMPTNGSGYDQFGLFNSYTPSSCSSSAVHWGAGKYRYIYFSNSTLQYVSNGGYLCCLESTVPTPALSATGVTNFTFYNGNTNLYNWSLIDSLSFTVNTVNKTVTYTIHASDLTRTGAALGSSTDYADSHAVQLTRTVYWRNSIQ